ncbi:MAG: helix-turn-helix domain-containing protein, partial [Rikenellaceae bacterium]
QEHDGKLYLSTYDNGLYVVDKQKLINSVEGSNISADYHYNAKSAKYNLDENLSVPYVYFSSRQTMWVYGEDYGVVKINSNNPSERVVYTKDIGNISSNNILSLSRYRENDVLVVSDSGLGVIHGANGAYEDLKIERLDSVITKVYVANDNELWIRSTTEWVEIDLLTNKIVERFPSKYGDIAFTNIYHDKSNDKIYYCSLDSYGEINHNNIIENQHAANDIAIVGLRLFDELIVPEKEYSEYVVLPKAIEYLDHIVLPYDLNTFTLEYAAVNASLVNKSAYRYRLLGFDDHWSENSNDSHSAKFHNVPPGEYQFQVIRGLYGDSVVKAMQVTIRPPWYKNRIAYMLYWLVVLSLCVVIGVVVVREQNRKLDEISRRRSIDYSNMKLNFMSNIFKQINAPLSNIFEECYDNEKIVSNINIIKKTVALFVDVASASDDEKTIDYNREKIENLAELNVKNGSHENLPSSSEAKLYVLLCESVESHISDVGLNVAMLSKVNGLSSKKIYYLFKNYAYLTPIDYIRKVRLKKAAELLCKGGFSVSEVLYIVGFSSHSYFTKCFKAEFGLNPKEYAKKHNVKIDDEKF